MINHLSPTEIEFLAEKQMVKITPKFTQNNVIYLISVSILSLLTKLLLIYSTETFFTPLPHSSLTPCYHQQLCIVFE